MTGMASRSPNFTLAYPVPHQRRRGCSSASRSAGQIMCLPCLARLCPTSSLRPKQRAFRSHVPQDTALQKSLLTPEPQRPEALHDEKLFRSFKEGRAETKGRFRSKLLPEAQLFLTQQRDLRLRYPEQEALRLEEEAKARHKIEELHKNYYALQASNVAGTTAQQTTGTKSMKNISRSTYYSFTTTGVFRP